MEQLNNKTLQSIDDTLKRIEKLLESRLKPMQWEKAPDLIAKNLEEQMKKSGSTHFTNQYNEQERLRRRLGMMVDKMCEQQKDCKNHQEARVMMCQELINVLKEMQGTDLEPYLADTKCTPHDRCLNITLKIPVFP